MKNKGDVDKLTLDNAGRQTIPGKRKGWTRRGAARVDETNDSLFLRDGRGKKRRRTRGRIKGA